MYLYNVFLKDKNNCNIVVLWSVCVLRVLVCFTFLDKVKHVYRLLNFVIIVYVFQIMN